MTRNEQIKNLLLEKKTYQEIGDLFGVSRERIRQIAGYYGLQGYGLQTRKHAKIKQELLGKKQRYGEFFVEGEVINKTFLSICKYKFARKKAQVTSKTTHEWTIQFSDIKWNTTCPILGIELDYTHNIRDENSPSFDRIDSSKGYIPGNVQIISWRANRIKNNGTLEDFKKLVEFMSRPI